MVNEPTPITVLICGDRNWDDDRLIRHQMYHRLPEGSTVIEGGARGADQIAGRLADKLGLNHKTFKADWDRYGKAAGAIRNNKMLDQKPNEVWAFHDDLHRSKGTAHCVHEARKRNIPVRVFSHE